MTEQLIKEKKSKVNDTIDELKPALAELARKIHKNPEIQFEEVKASTWLAEMSESSGFEVKKSIGGLETAFKADFQGAGSGPVIALLAEYDALLDVGHACGHNLICTAALGAAIGMSRHMNDVPGTIQIIGTPGEEGGGGKIILAEKGIFNDIDAAMMVHPMNKTVLWKHTLARHKLFVEFAGRASHAASDPYNGINALDAVIQTFNGINALRQQITEDARIHGIITNGGTSPNVIPEYASALFYIRALDNDYCNKLLEKVRQCAHGAALASGTNISLEMQGYYKSIKNNNTYDGVFRKNLESLGWTFTEEDPKLNIGSSDIGEVSHIVPVIHPYMKIGPAEMTCHTREFAEAAASEKGMDTMIDAAKAMAMTAVDLLLNPSHLEAIRREFEGK